MKFIPCLSLTLFSVLVFSPLANPSQSTTQLGWRLQSSGVLSKLNAVFFVDRQRGWVGGNNGMLLATEDGGKQWQPVLLPPKMRKEPLLDLWAFDQRRLFLLGEYGLFNRRPDIEWHDRVFLLRTDDRGALWTENRLARPPLQPTQTITIKKTTKETLEIEKPKPPPDPVLLRLAFAGERLGWAVGELGTIQATTDGGATWSLQFTQPRKILYDVAAIDDKQVWVVGAGGVAMKTSDGGQMWVELATGVTSALRAVHFADAQKGWAVGAAGLVISTSDGGVRWQKQTTPTANNLNDVFFVSAKEGWAAGEHGTLLHTTDGGATWKDASPGSRANLTRLFFVAPDRGWVVGSNGAVFSYSLIESAERPTLRNQSN